MNLGGERIALHGLVKSTRGCFSMSYSSTKYRSSSQMPGAYLSHCLPEKVCKIEANWLLFAIWLLSKKLSICLLLGSGRSVLYPQRLKMLSSLNARDRPAAQYSRGSSLGRHIYPYVSAYLSNDLSRQ